MKQLGVSPGREFYGIDDQLDTSICVSTELVYQFRSPGYQYSNGYACLFKLV